MAGRLKDTECIIEECHIALNDNIRQKIYYLSDYLEEACDILFDSIISSAFSEIIVLGNMNVGVSPVKIIDSFIDTSKNNHPDWADWDIIRRSSNWVYEGKKLIKKSMSIAERMNLRLVYCEIEEQTDKYQLMVDGLKNEVTANMANEAKAIQSQLQSSVTGAPYGMISSSVMSLLAHDLDDMRMRASQQKEADRKFQIYLSGLKMSAANNLISCYNDYKSNIFEPFYQEKVIQLLDSFKVLLFIKLSE